VLVSQVVELELDHQSLTKIEGLQRLGNLRKARSESGCSCPVRLETMRLTSIWDLVLFSVRSFCDNELTRVEGFERNPLLEELALEENGIAKIEVRICAVAFRFSSD
jgi:hypothetical protein